MVKMINVGIKNGGKGIEDISATIETPRISLLLWQALHGYRNGLCSLHVEVKKSRFVMNTSGQRNHWNQVNLQPISNQEKRGRGQDGGGGFSM